MIPFNTRFSINRLVDLCRRKMNEIAKIEHFLRLWIGCILINGRSLKTTSTVPLNIYFQVYRDNYVCKPLDRREEKFYSTFPKILGNSVRCTPPRKFLTFGFWLFVKVEVQYSAVECIAVQYIAVHCSTVQYIAVNCSTVQYIAVQCSTLQYSAVHCSWTQWNAVQCVTGHFSAV